MMRWFRKKPQAVVGLQPGRRSREEDFFRLFDTVDPKIPVFVLDALEWLAHTNPDLRNAVSNIVHLGNTGHELEIEADSDRVIEQAETRLSALAVRIWPHAGADGLVNRMLKDLAIYGAVSAEAVLAVDLSGVLRVVGVPHRTIRFRYNKEEDRYEPHQEAGLGETIPLNPETYFYIPLETVGNSPYGVPPMLAAIQPVLDQLYMRENLRYLVKKVGILGLVHAVLQAPPPRPGESEEQYQARLSSYLNQQTAALQEHYRDGLLVSFQDVDIRHFSVTGNASGVERIWQMNEEQIASGMDMDPAMLGRTYSTTETYAFVVYTKMVKKLENFQRVVRRALEAVYRLDLRLGGIPVRDVDVKFRPSAKMRPKEDAEIALLEAQRAVLLVQAGLADPAELRPEVGLESLTRLPAGRRVRFSWRGDRYVHAPEVIRLEGGASEDEEARLERLRRERVERYLEDVLGVDEQARRRIVKELSDRDLPGDPEAFVQVVMERVAQRYPELVKDLGLAEAVRRHISAMWQTFVGEGVDLTKKDLRAIRFLERADQFFLSTYVTNTPFQETLRRFLLDRVLEVGLDPQTAVKEILPAFEAEWGKKAEFRLRRIVDTAVTRARTYAHVLELARRGRVLAEIVEVLDRKTCATCRAFDGKIIPVSVAAAGVERVSRMTPEAFARMLHPVTPGDANAPYYTMLLEGQGIPPLHPFCRGRVRAYEATSWRKWGDAVPEPYRFDAPVVDYHSPDDIVVHGAAGTVRINGVYEHLAPYITRGDTGRKEAWEQYAVLALRIPDDMAYTERELRIVYKTGEHGLYYVFGKKGTSRWNMITAIKMPYNRAKKRIQALKMGSL